MDCAGIDLGNTYLWISLAGILFGGGFSFFLCPAQRRRPAVSIVLLSLAILSLLAAAIVSGFSPDDYGLKLLWLGVSAAAGFLCLLFWKVAGIPILFLFIIITTAVWYSFSGWSCAEPGTEICSFQTVSEGSDFVRIQYETADLSEIVKVQGESVYPVIDIITVPDYFFVLNKSRIYRFYGFSAEPDNNDASSADIQGFILERITGLPGFELVKGAAGPIRISPSLEYLLFFEADGMPGIKPQI